MPDFADDSLVSAVEDVVSCELAGGAALLDLRSSTYYSLNPVGAHVWELLQQPTSVADLQEALLARYEVEPAQCRQDLTQLLASLGELGVIKVVDAAAP